MVGGNSSATPGGGCNIDRRKKLPFWEAFPLADDRETSGFSATRTTKMNRPSIVRERRRWRFEVAKIQLANSCGRDNCENKHEIKSTFYNTCGTIKVTSSQFFSPQTSNFLSEAYRESQLCATSVIQSVGSALIRRSTRNWCLLAITDLGFRVVGS